MAHGKQIAPPLIFSCSLGYSEIVKYLLTLEVDILLEDENGKHALMTAIEKDKIDCYRLIMNYLTENHKEWIYTYITRKDKRGYTCLHYAVSNPEIMKDLLQYKPPLDELTNEEQYISTIYIMNIEIVHFI